jgi:N-acetylglucosaminyldiphosphoundecaprenol N-acetyl-beta-D-mannosaminyltransferase
MPKAELWAAAHRDLPARITLCIGGTMDVMGGNVKLAPAFWRKYGMEWVYRLIKQPRRAKRMLDIPRFVWAVLRGHT